MRVQYLDLKTGKTGEDTGISEFSLTEGNWSCDCNRAIPFERLDDSGTCIGCKRYVVIGVDPEDGDEPFEESAVIQEANREYFMRLNAT